MGRLKGETFLQILTVVLQDHLGLVVGMLLKERVGQEVSHEDLFCALREVMQVFRTTAAVLDRFKDVNQSAFFFGREPVALPFPEEQWQDQGKPRHLMIWTIIRL